LARAFVTLETERIKGSNPWCLWWWWRIKTINLFLCHDPYSCYKRLFLKCYGSALRASIPSV
jgi:hypothetical protein